MRTCAWFVLSQLLKFIIAGLALIHHNFVDAFFSKAFYKFLLGKAYSVEDMASVDRDFYSSLKWIRENRITPELDFYFHICEDVAGQVGESQIIRCWFFPQSL